MAVILIVDDNEDNRFIYSTILQFHGHEVHEAPDGAVGVQKARELSPEVIILDIAMPVMNGWEAIAELRADPSTASIPVVALTAHALISDEERAVAAGFHTYVRKPVEPNVVVALVEQIVGPSAKER